jgi:hypothetical protein
MQLLGSSAQGFLKSIDIPAQPRNPFLADDPLNGQSRTPDSGALASPQDPRVLSLLSTVFYGASNSSVLIHEHSRLFRDEGIDYEALTLMREDHFRELGIKMGVRVRILDALKERRKTDSQPASTIDNGLSMFDHLNI